MIEKSKRQKKCSISEADVSTLLQRYDHTTVLTLLQEVVKLPDAKIDWSALVKKTSTGITNAREYQMLWRHLAYSHALICKLEDGAGPLDDDSDLEYELETSPLVGADVSTDAAALVKVLIASAMQNDSKQSNHSTIEASLTINIPAGQTSGTFPENSQPQGINITVPVSVEKQPLPSGVAAEDSDANKLAGTSLPPRKRRKPWTAAEDRELIAAVQKCGEGNWANILKGDFTGDRTASQLSQRWAIIRKRNGNLNLGGPNPNGQLSQAQLAARHAMSVALNMPVGNLTASNTLDTFSPGSSLPQIQHGSQQRSTQASSQTGSSISAQKPRQAAKKASAKPITSPNSMLQAAAVAAGARIATPEDAASLLKAAQAKNAVHIMPGGGSLIKSSTSPQPVGQLGAHNNVHYVRAGISSSSASTYSVGMSSISKADLPKPSPQSIQSTNPTSSSLGIEKTKATALTSSAVELSSKEEVKDNEEIKNSRPISQETESAVSESISGQVKGASSTQETTTECPSDIINEPKEHSEENQVCLTNDAPDQKSQDGVSPPSIADHFLPQENGTAAAHFKINQQCKGDVASSISEALVKDAHTTRETGQKSMEEDKDRKASENEVNSKKDEQRSLSSVVGSGIEDKLLIQDEEASITAKEKS